MNEGIQNKRLWGRQEESGMEHGFKYCKSQILFQSQYMVCFRFWKKNVSKEKVKVDKGWILFSNSAYRIEQFPYQLIQYAVTALNPDLS